MRRHILLLTLALTAACSDGDEAFTSEPLTLPSIYSTAIVGPCSEWCWSLTLYRSQSEIELRAYESNGNLLGIATGALSDQTNTQLSAMIESLSSGEQSLGELPGMPPIDGTANTLWLPSLTLSYATNYPPSGLSELDELLSSILDDLSQCRTNLRVHSDPDCEQLAYFPE